MKKFRMKKETKIALFITAVIVVIVGAVSSSDPVIKCEVCDGPMEKPGSYAVFQPEQLILDDTIPFQKIAAYWTCPEHPRMLALICTDDKKGKRRVYKTKMITEQSNIKIETYDPLLTITATGKAR